MLIKKSVRVADAVAPSNQLEDLLVENITKPAVCVWWVWFWARWSPNVGSSLKQKSVLSRKLRDYAV
jgi:hypothetical protein